MAYLRWSGSPWYAYSHIDGGEGDDALLEAWHERGFRFAATAGTLDRAGCHGSPGNLRVLMAGMPGVDAAALADVHKLGTAVDQFLFDVHNAGKIPMPPMVARRYRVLKQLLKRALRQPRQSQGEDERGFPLWFGWYAELNEINRQYPPPDIPREIRDLMQARALRALAGEVVLAEQETSERRLIAAAQDFWPPVESATGAGTIGRTSG